ncbi:DUF2059 domain-containing protein [Tropicibacter naphthalenivorans]|uniref:DUF2059 domain-containing protein n=1 Tax=Tropicibacter naphthalenivorans TaxID=441103 RepID=A0A0N7LZH6_9RHOB|nr:DUF2059 domain-containing protein [Tropicibacter naphthalenivorans]CUH77689.1 hypothetical protein TRN7648_01614 [Tropicibacter naphthalenivorans]SMC54246.1 hypothetical protein SAMN04488093_1023 [Tropicibacter naphthalenivorans]
MRAQAVQRIGMTLGAALLAWPLHAAPADDLIDALRLDDMIATMRTEGLAYGAELGEDMFQGGDAGWQRLLEDIYDTDRMESLIEAEFTAALGDTDLTPLIDFFESDQGQEIVELELAAREAMIDDEVEEMARSTYRFADPDGGRTRQITRFIEANDLLDSNVAGAMNASFRFYLGLVDGGGFEMSESDIIQDVWAQEPETRSDTQEWLYGFLLMAYDPLSDRELDQYIDLSATPEGMALNRALFTAFNKMYDDISYALGLAAAQQMQGQDL